MNNNSSEKDQGSRKATPFDRDKDNARKAQPEEIDPSVDVEMDDEEEGSEEVDGRRAEGTDVEGEKSAPAGRSAGGREHK